MGPSRSSPTANGDTSLADVAFRIPISGDVSIARAAPEDAIVIHEIQMRAFAEEGRVSGTVEIPPLMETIESIELLIRNHTVLTARHEDRVVGSARGIASGSICTIRGVLVEPSCQGRGIGASLLRAVEQRHPQVERFELTTNTLVPGNVQFYERRGYTVHELTQYSDTIVLAQMRKPGRAAGA
jgi:GNAT superfamily N-acetyltransferase